MPDDVSQIPCVSSRTILGSEFETKNVQGRKVWRLLSTDLHELKQEISVVPKDKKMISSR